MFNWRLSSIFKYNKYKKQNNYDTENPTEVEVAEKFKTYFLDNFDYDYCKTTIEDYNEINLSSSFVNEIIKNSKIQNEFNLKKYIIEHIGEPEPNKKIVLFKFYRNVSKNIYEYFNLIGSFVFKKNDKNASIYFFHFNERLFNHHKFFGDIPANNNLNLKKDESEYKFQSQLEQLDIKICNSYYYHYDFKDNKLEYLLYLPLIQSGGTSLNLRNSNKESFFSFNKVYSIECLTNIKSNNFCSDSKVNLYYGEDCLREIDFDFYNKYDLINAIERLLFPFFLPDDKKIELSLENITLDQIKNNFEKEFELYKIVKL